MLTKSGAKLMDFGLAKPAVAAIGAGSSSGSLATMSQPLTAEGMVLGTFQYMSPEQVEGKEADARSDIFALGAVLYEMVTGKRAFEGRTPASTIATILAGEPTPISTIQPMSSPALEAVVKECLAKDPDERVQTAHDVKLQLKWIAESDSKFDAPSRMVAKRTSWNRAGWLLAALLLLVMIAGGAVWWLGAQQSARTMYFNSPITLPANDIALSPDGRTLAIVAYQNETSKYVLWTHPLGGQGATPVPGTEDASHPFWSPDSRSIAFFAQGKLKKIDLSSGGSAQVLCDAPHGRGGSWNREGVILFTCA